MEPGQWKVTQDVEQEVQGAKGLWYSIRDVFFYPGDTVVRVLAERYPDFAGYLEHSHANMAGIFSGIISIVIWITLLMVVTSLMRLLRGHTS